MKWCITLLVILSNSVWAKQALSTNTWQDPAFVQSAFIHVALRNEYSKGKKPLVRWKQPVKIWVDHRVADVALHDELTNLHIRHLADVTGHPIYRVQQRSDANVVWVFTREVNWAKDIAREISPQAAENLQGSLCKAGYTTNSHTQEIINAAIVIPVDQAREHGKLLACIVEEITQVLGLPNDTDFAYPSVFNDSTPEDLLSPLDIVLLKLLYDDRLTPGMTQADVTPVIATIISQYQSQGILEGAAKEAKAAPLYQLIGY